jgi:small subunit ribosomal protein S35
MAAALQSFRFAVRSCNCRHISPRHVAKSIGRGREFSTTPQRWLAASIEEIEERLSKAAATNRDAAEYMRVSKETEEELAALEESMQQEEEESRQRYAARHPPYVLPLRRKRLKDTFMNMGDPEPWEEEGMLDDDHDDMTSLAHGELEQHREMRHYARLAAWEMPLLSSRCYLLDLRDGISVHGS